MKTLRKTTVMLALGMLLSGGTTALCQSQSGGNQDGVDQTVKSGQNDTEDHETGLDWVGLFGVLGLAGLLGPRSEADNRRSTTTRRVVSIATVLATSALLSIGTPAMSQPEHEADRSKSITSSQSNYSGGEPSLGWIGVIGLAGLLGLRRGRRKTDHHDHPRDGRS